MGTVRPHCDLYKTFQMPFQVSFIVIHQSTLLLSRLSKQIFQFPPREANSIWDEHIIEENPHHSKSNEQIGDEYLGPEY